MVSPQQARWPLSGLLFTANTSASQQFAELSTVDGGQAINSAVYGERVSGLLPTAG